jgi:aconitate hydratase
LSGFSAGKPLTVTLTHSNGTKDDFQVNQSYNKSQIEWFKAGSALNIIRKSNKKNV